MNSIYTCDAYFLRLGWSVARSPLHPSMAILVIVARIQIAVVTARFHEQISFKGASILGNARLHCFFWIMHIWSISCYPWAVGKNCNTRELYSCDLWQNAWFFRSRAVSWQIHFAELIDNYFLDLVAHNGWLDRFLFQQDNNWNKTIWVVEL